MRKVLYCFKQFLIIIILAFASSFFFKTYLLGFYLIPSSSMRKALTPGDGILVSKLHYHPTYFSSGLVQRNDVIVVKGPQRKSLTLIKRCIGLPGDTVMVINHRAYVAPLDNSRFESGRKLELVPPLGRLLCKHAELPHFSGVRDRSLYGPLVIPKAGMELHIDASNIKVYKNMIRRFEGDTIRINKNQIFINGKEVTTYTFKKDYYFLLGDNRRHSIDSRYWGLLPKDRIIGKAVVKVFSYDKKKGLSSLRDFFKKIN